MADHSKLIFSQLMLSVVTVSSLEYEIIPEDYMPDLAPRPADGGPIVASISMTMNAVSEIDIKRQTLLFEMYFRMAWQDDRLLFPQLNTTSDAVDLSTKFLKKIWVPDPFFPDARNVETLRLVAEFGTVRLFRNKTILISQMLKVRCACPMSFQRYPFDQQVCHLNISSYTYGASEMIWEWSHMGLQVADKVESFLSNYHFKLTQEPYNRCICDKCMSDYYPCVSMKLSLDRKYIVHIMGAYIPSTMFVGVAWMSLVWPADVIPGRTVLTVTALLSQCTVYFQVGKQSPITSYVKAVDVWLFFCIILSISVLFEYGIVLKIKRLQENSINPLVAPNNVVSVQPMLKEQPAPRNNEKSRFIKMEENVEYTTLIGIPVTFILFCCIYWPAYLS